jgi:hypothetical protein
MACFLPSGCKFYCMQARSRYKLSSGRVFIPVSKIGKRPVAQCRGINYPGATNCLGIESFITCSGAHPGLRLRLIPVDGSEPAKSMTNNLPLLSVLAFRARFITIMVSLSVSQVISKSGACFDCMLNLTEYYYFLSSRDAVRVYH